MNLHNFFNFPFTAIDQKTNQIVLLDMVNIASSTSNSSKEGNIFSKTYENSNTYSHHHNIQYPNSTIVDKLRCISNPYMNQVNYTDKEYEFTSVNKKHGHILYQFLYKKLSLILL